MDLAQYWQGPSTDAAEQTEILLEAVPAKTFENKTYFCWKFCELHFFIIILFCEVQIENL